MAPIPTRTIHRVTLREAKQSWGALTLRVQAGDLRVIRSTGKLDPGDGTYAIAMPAVNARRAVYTDHEAPVTTMLTHAVRRDLGQVCRDVDTSALDGPGKVVIATHGQEETIAIAPLSWAAPVLNTTVDALQQADRLYYAPDNDT